MNFLSIKIRYFEDQIVLGSSEISIFVPLNIQKLLQKHMTAGNSNVIMGIRASDIYEKGTKNTNGVEICVTVDSVEPQGHETHVKFELLETTVTAQLQANTAAQVGNKITLLFDTSNIYL